MSYNIIEELHKEISKLMAVVEQTNAVNATLRQEVEEQAVRLAEQTVKLAKQDSSYDALSRDYEKHTTGWAARAEQAESSLADLKARDAQATTLIRDLQSEKVHAKAIVERLEEEVERLKAEQGYDRHASLEAALAEERRAHEATRGRLDAFRYGESELAKNFEAKAVPTIVKVLDQALIAMRAHVPFHCDDCQKRIKLICAAMRQQKKGKK